MNIQRLTLETQNIKIMNDFYSQMLDLPVKLENAALEIQIGSSQLVFLENPDSSAKYHIAFNIPEQQIETALAWLEARVEILQDAANPISDFPNWNAHAIYFCDPAGNILELIARHELTHETIIPFTSRALLNISEIGMAVPNTTEFADWTEKTLTIPKYRQGSSSFIPIGDAHGLLIAVPSGREWHPNTGIIALPHPTKIELQTEILFEARFFDLPYVFSNYQEIDRPS